MTRSDPVVGRPAIVADFLQKVGRFEFDGAAEHLADDAVMVLPYVEQVEDVHGRAAIAERLAATVPAMVTGMVFTFDAWYEADGADVVIAEYRSVCPWRERDGAYENTYIGVYGFTGDKITLYKEYLNPLRLTAG